MILGRVPYGPQNGDTAPKEVLATGVGIGLQNCGFSRSRRFLLALTCAASALILSHATDIPEWNSASAQTFSPERPVPQPPARPQQSSNLPRFAIPNSRTKLVDFELSPFPYDGNIANTNRPFIDVDEHGRRGHRTSRGGVLWEDETYSDQRVLLHIPQGFDIKRPAVIVIFFHGHRATIGRDVRDRQKVADQIAASRANAVLVAPQFAVAANDSSAGIFWEPGLCAAFLAEAAEQLGILHGGPKVTRIFDEMPIVFVSYSGGYLPTAWCLHHGGLENRIKGVILLDSLYGEMDKFQKWISTGPGRQSAFFVTTYLGSTRARNLEMQSWLANRNIAYSTTLDRQLRPGSVNVVPGGPTDNHEDFANKALGTRPIMDMLNRLIEIRR